MGIATLLGIATLVLGVPVNVYAVIVLRQLSRRAPRSRTLRERYIAAIVTTATVLVFGLIFVNNDHLPVPWLNLDATKLITRTMILIMAGALPLFWIRMQRTTERRTEQDAREVEQDAREVEQNEREVEQNAREADEGGTGSPTTTGG